MPFKRLTSILLVFLLGSIYCAGQTFKVAAWNLESGDSQLQALTARVRTFQGVDIWGFSELQSQSVLNAMTVAAADGESGTFRSILGSTGDGDRLAIVYNSTRFQLISSEELDDINVSGTVRAPLVALFKERNSNREFYFMVNHLYRGSEQGRHEQSRLLRLWAMAGSASDRTSIAVGDFNYDLNVNNPSDHDRGYDLLTQGGVFRWARPATLVRTQCSYNSVLDFVFVSGEAKNWQSTSLIDAKPDDCPDNADRSDHRPISTTFTMSNPGGPAGPAGPAGSMSVEEKKVDNRQEEIMNRIRMLEEELRKLKELVEKPN